MILVNIRQHKIIFIHLVSVSRVMGEYLQFDLLHSLCIGHFVSNCCCCVDIRSCNHDSDATRLSRFAHTMYKLISTAFFVTTESIRIIA